MILSRLVVVFNCENKMKIEQIRKLQRNLEDQLKAVKLALKTAEELASADYENILKERVARQQKADAAWSRRAKKLIDAVSVKTDGIVGSKVRVIDGEHKDRIGWCSDISIHVFKSRKHKPLIKCTVRLINRYADPTVHEYFKTDYIIFQPEQIEILKK